MPVKLGVMLGRCGCRRSAEYGLQKWSVEQNMKLKIKFYII